MSSDLEDARAEIASLRAEARSFGVYVTVDTLSVLRDTVAKIREARQDKPPCYWRAYDKLARECRICEARAECARGEDVPLHVPTDELRPASCARCGGPLCVELVDSATETVHDYACADPECDGVLGEQTRHVPPQAPPPIRVKGPAKQMSAAELDDKILSFLASKPGAKIRDVVEALGPELSAKSKRDAIRALQHSGKIETERVAHTLRLFVAGQD